MSEIFGRLDSIIINTGSSDKDLQTEANDQLQEIIQNIKTLNNDTPSISLSDTLKNSELSKNISYFLDKFSSVPKHISDLRSNFIPVDVLNPASSQFQLGSIDVGGDASYVPDNFSLMESYENTFMRILGMPESADISPDEDIFIIGPDFSISKIKAGKLFSETPGLRSADGLDILDERQRNASDRLIYLKQNFYSYQEMSEELDIKAPEETAPAVVGATTPEQIVLSSIDINEDHSKLTNILYLKCLPIQDSRFLKCISETGKIVSKPFDDRMIKVVNKEKIKTSFLENIIRLRLDKISGVSHSIDDIDNQPGSGSAYSISGINTYSIFEKLMLDKLSSMLSSVASQYYITLKQAVEEAEKQIERGIRANSTPSGGTSSTGGPTAPQNDDEISELKKSLDVQDAILYILKDTSISSYLYELNQGERSQKTLEGYIRNSSGFDDRISESLISIIEAEASIYRDLINKKISDRKPSAPAGPPPGSGNKTPPIITGNDAIPIGLIDIIVYALALFSMDEYSLINLLNSKQKEILAKTLSKNATVDSLFSSKEFNMTSPASSINKLTIYIYIYYKLFIDSLNRENINSIISSYAQIIKSDADGTILDNSGNEQEIKQ